MNAYSNVHSVIELTEIAKKHLIEARFEKQAAQRARDFCKYNCGPWSGLRTLAEDYENKARWERAMARDALTRAEAINGRDYVRGFKPQALSYYLAGREFATWPRYKAHKMLLEDHVGDIWR